MYVDKALREAVAYKFGKDNKGNAVAQVSYRGNPIAVLAVPTYETDVESAQRHIYAVTRSFIRMMEPNSTK